MNVNKIIMLKLLLIDVHIIMILDRITSYKISSTSVWFFN